MRSRWSAAVLVSCAAWATGCETEEARPRGVELVQLEREATATAASLRAQTEDGEAARALLVRGDRTARLELELEGDRFLAELDPDTGTIEVIAEVDGELVRWSPGDGAMPEALAARWSDVVATWRAELLDDEGRLRPEHRDALNVPADSFATVIDGVPVSQSYWCPPREECWFDESTGAFVCELLYDVWCPPPPPEPCWGVTCEPCGGLYCPPPPPCDTWFCPPPCVGLWCGPCEPWDPFCAQ